MEVDSHVLSAGEKADGRRAVTGTDQRRPRFDSTVKPRLGCRAIVRRQPGHCAALAPVRRLLACAAASALKFFVALAALGVSIFSGGPEVGSRATSAPCAGSPISSGSAKDEEELISGRVYNHEYCSMTAEAKTLACNTVVTAADVFWLGCPGPPSFSM